MVRLNRSKVVWGWCLAGVLVLGVWGSGPVNSADPAGAKGEAGQEAKSPRLPNHFGKLSLSEEQKGKVFATQMKYAKEIDELKARLKKLQGEQQKELEGVLTTEQRSRLKLLKSESRKKPASTAGKKS